MGDEPTHRESLTGAFRRYLEGTTSREEVRGVVFETCNALSVHGESPERILITVKSSLAAAVDGMDRSLVWQRHELVQERLARWVLRAYFHNPAAASDSPESGKSDKG